MGVFYFFISSLVFFCFPFRYWDIRNRPRQATSFARLSQGRLVLKNTLRAHTRTLRKKIIIQGNKQRKLLTLLCVPAKIRRSRSRAAQRIKESFCFFLSLCYVCFFFSLVLLTLRAASLKGLVVVHQLIFQSLGALFFKVFFAFLYWASFEGKEKRGEFTLYLRRFATASAFFFWSFLFFKIFQTHRYRNKNIYICLHLSCQPFYYWYHYFSLRKRTTSAPVVLSTCTIISQSLLPLRRGVCRRLV